MKKTLKRMIALSFVCIVLLTSAVFAEEYYKADANGEFSVDYNGTADDYYALLVVEGVYGQGETPVISEDTVVYMGQTKANAQGKADFNNWEPKNDSPATVYVGGAENGPVLLGYINAENVAKKVLVDVQEGDVVYLQDGATVIAAQTGTVATKDQNGVVVVNSGMESQKIYYIDVYEGTATLVATDAVVGTKLISLRNDTEDATKSGVRFKMTHNPATKGAIVEYGFIMTAETNKVINGAGADYVLDKAMVDAEYAKLGMAWSKAEGGNGKWFNKDDDTKWIISGVLHNIPMTKDGVKTTIASRPYAVYEDGTYVYGEITKTTLYNTCKAYEKVNFEGCSSEDKKFIKGIIQLVEGDKDIFIDISKLYGQN